MIYVLHDLVKTGNLDQATGTWYIKNFEKK